MPKYKLIYSNARGRAEPSRIVFHLAGQEYEDHRLQHATWFVHWRYERSCESGK